MQSIKVEDADGSVTVWNGVLGLFIPFSLIVAAILTAKLIELGACRLFKLYLLNWTGPGMSHENSMGTNTMSNNAHPPTDTNSPSSVQKLSGAA